MKGVFNVELMSNMEKIELKKILVLIDSRNMDVFQLRARSKEKKLKFINGEIVDYVNSKCTCLKF